MGLARTLLIEGNAGVGKTALIRRFVDGVCPSSTSPTIGLDEHAGNAKFALGDTGLTEELAALLPPEGLEISLLEIGGGKGGRLRQVPRGRQIDGLLICYSPFDRASFQNVVHRVMQHRTDRHLQMGAPSLVAPGKPGAVAPELPVVMCATHLDEVDAGKPRLVTEAEAQACALENGIRHALITSAKTGEFVQEAFQALAAAVLEAEEIAEAEALVAARAPLPQETWGLGSASSSRQGLGFITSPIGARPHEGSGDKRLVEVIGLDGVAYGARPLQVCLERGLLHRAVHVWLCDLRTGGLLLRKYAPASLKLPQRWGPTCHGEVHCYGSTADAETGPFTAELSMSSAARIMREQLGVERPPDDLEHWFSCSSRDGNSNELIDVFVARLRDGALPQLSLHRDEEIEWVHYLDIFGTDVQAGDRLFKIETSYRASMVQKLCGRIVHADHEEPVRHSTGLAGGRPTGALPIG